MPSHITIRRQWRGVVWNACGDEIEQFDLHLPAGMPPPAAVTQVDARGHRYPARLEGRRVKLGRPMYQFEFVVLS